VALKGAGTRRAAGDEKRESRGGEPQTSKKLVEMPGHLRVAGLDAGPGGCGGQLDHRRLPAASVHPGVGVADRETVHYEQTDTRRQHRGEDSSSSQSRARTPHGHQMSGQCMRDLKRQGTCA